MQFIKGPDFPTGGIIYRYREEGKGEDDADAIAQGYSMGKSRLIVQAKAHFEEISRGRTRIIVTELPYQTNKTALIERIADLVRDGKLEGISDLRDESDRTGMRIVIELSRNVEPKDVLANLYKYTPLQQTFGMQLLALVDGQPRLLSLKRMLQLFVQHRQEIIRRRSEFDLKQAQERAHIVEGLLRALDILDEVIHTIRHSQTVDTARKNLMANFKFTELQAQAILDMQLRRLAALERKRLQEEYDELKKRIAYLEDLLAHPHKILGVIRDELVAIRQEYADARRTQIVDRTRGALTTHDLLPDQMVWVSMSRNGDVRRQPAVSKPGVAALRQMGKDSQIALLAANTRDVLYVFSAMGAAPASASTRFRPTRPPSRWRTLPASRAEMGWRRSWRCRARSEQGGYFFFASERGAVKRVGVADVQANTASEFTVFNVEDGDRLGWAMYTHGSQEVLLLTAEGQSIRFGEDEVRVMGLPAGGVGGMKLRGKDRLVFAGVVDPTGELATLSAQGFAKRTALAEYSSQGRNGGGILAHKLVERTGKLGAGMLLPSNADPDNVLLVSVKGVAKPITVADIPRMGRAASGKQILTLAEKDTVSAAWHVGGGRKGPGGEGGPENDPEGSTAAGTAAAAPAPTRRQAAKQVVPPEQVELLEEAASGSRAAAVTAGAKGHAASQAVAAPLPLKTVKGSTHVEPAPAAILAPKPAQKPAEQPPVARAAKTAAREAAAASTNAKPAVKASAKPPAKTAEHQADAPAQKPGEQAKQSGAHPAVVQAAAPTANLGANPGTTTGAKDVAAEYTAGQQGPSQQGPSKQESSKQESSKSGAGKPEAGKSAQSAEAAKTAKTVTPAKPAAIPVKPPDANAKGKPSAKPTPAEIASGTRGGSAKQAAEAPRFAFADEVEANPKSAGKPSPKKLDTVVSVTKSQAGHAKAEKDEPPEKAKPKK